MYQHFPHLHNHGVLPPGYYIHSGQLLNTMTVTQPNYYIKLEPIYFDHLMLHLNKRIQVSTINEKLTGVLTGVAVDHLQLTVEGVNYHIRFENITYFRLA